jgi:Suppressor of fused protein (SUFU)
LAILTTSPVPSPASISSVPRGSLSPGSRALSTRTAQSLVLTPFTYGLSLADHADWKLGAPELVICVQSEDPAWGWAVAEVASRLRGRCPFCIGNTINFQEQIAAESEMSAFFVFYPSVLDQESATVTLPERPVHIVGMYPIYEGEISIIQQIGPVAFWDLDGYDCYSVHRPDLSQRSS